MKAFLLAAGLGTRLRPLTDHTPKCLVPIAGKSLLEWWFILMQRHGIREFLINTHHLPDQVHEFVRANSGRYGLIPTITYEPDLIGSAGTLRENFDFVREEANFFVLYADNLTDADLTSLLEFHTSRPAMLTMALYRMDHPETRGIAEIGLDGKIVSFTEKPKEPKTDLANGGIYVMSSECEPFLDGAFDIGFDVLPKLHDKMWGLEMHGYLKDIGTPESLAQASADWFKLRR